MYSNTYRRPIDLGGRSAGGDRPRAGQLTLRLVGGDVEQCGLRDGVQVGGRQWRNTRWVGLCVNMIL